MKLLHYLLLFFLFISCDKQEKFVKTKITLSAIDSLNTPEQVEWLIAKTDTLFKKFTLKKVQDIECRVCDSSLVNLANRLKINNTYYKADFDNNGYTDLLVTGVNKTYTGENYDPNLDVEYSKEFNALVMMNFGKDKIKLYDLTSTMYNAMVPTVEYFGIEPFLVVYKPGHTSRIKQFRSKETKLRLIFKSNYFIEYNPNPVTYDFEKIEYSTTGCYGMCPIFELAIKKNGQATLLAKNYNYTEKWQKGTLLNGSYKTSIQDEQMKEITDLFNYLHFANLKDDYTVPWFDDQTGILKVTYNDGKVKTITDYGLQGTYGLKEVHDVLFKLRTNQKWTR